MEEVRGEVREEVKYMYNDFDQVGKHNLYW